MQKISKAILNIKQNYTTNAGALSIEVVGG